MLWLVVVGIDFPAKLQFRKFVLRANSADEAVRIVRDRWHFQDQDKYVIGAGPADWEPVGPVLSPVEV